MFLAAHIVAMVICYMKPITATCLPMNGNLYDTIIMELLVEQRWLHSSLKVKLLEKVLELLPASLSRCAVC